MSKSVTQLNPKAKKEQEKKFGYLKNINSFAVLFNNRVNNIWNSYYF